jgi:fatty acid kinase
LPQERQGHQGSLRDELVGRARGALGAIEASRRRIDDLNVYPVPDGDTGTNLTLSVRAIVESLERSEVEDRVGLAEEASRAALMGARGNSGVILSQIVRGAAESFAESDDVARALRRASDTAYAQIGRPVEGTMLTAIRELAEEAEAGGDLDAIIERGDDCVARTRGMLPTLREAGVVDAGAAALVELVRGFAGRAAAVAPAQTVSLQSVHRGLSRFRFCTSFVVEGEALDSAALERELEGIGDSILVVGGDTALRIHVHTDEPDRAVAFGRARGVVEALEVADMHEQILAREERLSHPVVAVVDGEGNRRLFESLGAGVVDAVPPAADGVIVLSDITTSLPAGLSALVAYDAERPVAENVAAMREAVAAVVSGSVRRDADAWAAFVEDEPIATNDTFHEAALAVVARLLAEPKHLLTLLAGVGAPPLDGLIDELRTAHPGLEIEAHEGGQSASALLLGAE